MNINVGESVASTVCKTMYGKVKRIIDENNFILQISNKEILCNSNFWTKI